MKGSASEPTTVLSDFRSSVDFELLRLICIVRYISSYSSDYINFIVHLFILL